MACINGKRTDTENVTMIDYLIENRFDTNRVAVEINGKILSKKDYDKYIICKEDKIEIVCFVGGG